MKMKQTAGGGYWLEVGGNRFEVVLADDLVVGIYGRMVANREYLAYINGRRVGGPYDSAAEGKARVAPFVEQAERKVKIEDRRYQIKVALDDLYPMGLPPDVENALDGWDGSSLGEKPAPKPEETIVDLDELLAPEVQDDPPAPVEEPEVEVKPEPVEETVEEPEPEPTPEPEDEEAAEVVAELRTEKKAPTRRAPRKNATRAKATASK